MRWTRPEIVFDEKAISHQLHGIGNTRAGLRVGSRFDFNRDEAVAVSMR
jgi:hypothetical protein